MTRQAKFPTIEEVERDHVMRVLEACGGNRTAAARVLGVDRKTLSRRLRRWISSRTAAEETSDSNQAPGWAAKRELTGSERR